MAQWARPCCHVLQHLTIPAGLMDRSCSARTRQAAGARENSSYTGKKQLQGTRQKGSRQSYSQGREYSLVGSNGNLGVHSKHS